MSNTSICGVCMYVYVFVGLYVYVCFVCLCVCISDRRRDREFLCATFVDSTADTDKRSRYR